MEEVELYHHGVKGQHWGVRRYQNEDGTLTDAGKRAKRREVGYTIGGAVLGSSLGALLASGAFKKIGADGKKLSKAKGRISYKKAIISTALLAVGAGIVGAIIANKKAKTATNKEERKLRWTYGTNIPSDSMEEVQNG